MAAVDPDDSAPVSRRAFRLALAGLMLTLTLAALDQNIVSTALPRIVGDLGGLTHLSWVVTAFMLASTATTPLYGKLSDLYGRRPLFIIAILLFIAGSMLCGLARSMTELILFRGVQGLGAGGLISLAQIAIADLVSPRQRGRYQGMGTAVFAICSIAGPLIGGFLTDVLSWRWIFYVNLPVGSAALVLILIGMPRSSNLVHHRIDYVGAALLTAATVCLLLALSWGGAVYAWTSPTVLALGIGGVLLLGALIAQERVATEPVVPLPLFANRTFVIAVVVSGVAAIALFGSFVFLPAFFQLVLGVSPAQSGLMTSPLMAGLIVASAIGGRMVATTGRYKSFPVAGLATSVLCFLGLAYCTGNGTATVAIEILLVLLGAGMGLVLPNLTVAIQNAVAQTELGIATSAASFFRSLGGALGVAVAGALMTAALNRSPLAASTASGSAGQSFESIAKLPVAAQQALGAAYRDGISATFLVAAAITGFGFLLALLLPELPLRDKPGGAKADQPSA